MEKSKLQKRVESGEQIILAEIAPPKTPDAAQVRALAKSFAGKVHALGVSDNRDGVAASALSAASLVLAEGVEPILHMTTRDRTRTALISDCLGAEMLGIHNILCTSGTHPSLHPFHGSKSVYDIDATLLIQSCKNLEKDASIVGEKSLNGKAVFCIGAVASPYADPMELQLPRLAQKIFAGAQFLITQPVFDLDRFGAWWKEVTNHGLHKKAAIIAGIRVLTDPAAAKAYAEKRPLPMVPEAMMKRIAAGKNGRAEGIAIALETIKKLSAFEGLRGFEIACDEDHSAIL
jgi:methylenetetrahydrofolate reductase (NADPH)